MATWDVRESPCNTSNGNRLQADDKPIHDWYRFVLSYPPHLVREYLKAFRVDPQSDLVLDPFCGTGTTPVEAKLRGFRSAGVEANPMLFLASSVKTHWSLDTVRIRALLDHIIDYADGCVTLSGLPTVGSRRTQLSLPGWAAISRVRDPNSFDPDFILPSEAYSLIPEGFIGRNQLTRVLSLRQALERIVPDGPEMKFLQVGLAKTIVAYAGNVGFGPEVYRLPQRPDSDIVGAYWTVVSQMIEDLRYVQGLPVGNPEPKCYMFDSDARELNLVDDLPPIGCVVTSPPYPNEKDYTRSTRLESVLLGLIRSKSDLRHVKDHLLRSNTRTVFARDDDDRFIRDIKPIVQVSEEIERRRVELHKTSGFERLYHKVTLLYFGGMYRHLASLLPHLKHGARCAYVVGDQMSYFRVHIQTAKLLAEVALKAGYEVEGIDLWRTRRATATRRDIDENVLIIRRPRE
ncbi:MAG: hypothetical protein HPY55_09135 [Firmicutes bacterium]|nr:hypothetical protein [Bacillota bacterium]